MANEKTLLQELSAIKTKIKKAKPEDLAKIVDAGFKTISDSIKAEQANTKEAQRLHTQTQKEVTEVNKQLTVEKKKVKEIGKELTDTRETLADALEKVVTYQDLSEEDQTALRIEVMEMLQIEMKKEAELVEAEKAQKEADERPAPKKFIPANIVTIKGVNYTRQNNVTNTTGGYNEVEIKTCSRIFEAMGRLTFIEEIPEENREPDEENIYLLYVADTKIEQVPKPVVIPSVEEPNTEDDA